MKKTTAIRRVVNCLNAEKRALHGEFKSYWSHTAQKIAKSNDIDDVAVSDGSAVEPADLTNSMAAYSAAISKTKDIKLSK